MSYKLPLGVVRFQILGPCTRASIASLDNTSIPKGTCYETFSYTKGIVFKYFAKIVGEGAWSILKIQYWSVRIWCNPREAWLHKKTWALGLYEMWKAQYSLNRISEGKVFKLSIFYLLHICIFFLNLLLFKYIFIQGNGKKNHMGLYIGGRVYF